MKVLTPCMSLLIFFLVASAVPKESLAASQNECAIWLCLPAGFPGNECRAPHNEMIKRIKKGKSPLPSFSGCSIDSPQGDSVKTKNSYAAYYYNRMKCTRQNRDGDCIGFKQIPNKLVPDGWCKKEPYTEAYRSECKSIKYILTIIDGRPWGEPIYYDDRGNIYKIQLN